jgi:trk system potassium uptake protein TrkH
MPAFDSVNHAMTAIATGGFGVKNASIGHYGNAAAEAVIVLTMLAGSISFVAHKRLFEGNWRAFVGDVEVKALVACVLAAALALTLHYALVTRGSIALAEYEPRVLLRGRQAVFQSASAISGTGFQTTDLAPWSDFSKWILTALMVIGGAAGSTSSAIKLIRFVIIFRATIWVVHRLFLPSKAVLPFRVGGRVLSEGDIMSAALYAFLYLVVLFSASLALMSMGYNGTDSFFEVASAQGNVGLTVGITRPAMEPAAKVVFIAVMLVGRLEILPYVALAGFWFRKR